jgi:hypothetical protein
MPKKAKKRKNPKFRFTAARRRALAKAQRAARRANKSTKRSNPKRRRTVKSKARRPRRRKNQEMIIIVPAEAPAGQDLMALPVTNPSRRRRSRKNIAAGFYDDSGFHPIRASYDYSSKRAGEGGRKSRRRKRK